MLCGTLSWSASGDAEGGVQSWRESNFVSLNKTRQALSWTYSGGRCLWRHGRLRQPVFFIRAAHRSVSEIQGDSVARGPKLLSIKNYVIEIMTWKFIYTYRERCKTGPAHNRCWNWSPFTSKHTWMRFSKFWNSFPQILFWGPPSERITLYFVVTQRTMRNVTLTLFNASRILKAVYGVYWLIYFRFP